jgi:indole-3-glycerol phosphate synthase
MANFLKEMAIASAARATASKASFTASKLDLQVFPLRLSEFDLIAEIKNRSPAEGQLAGSDESRIERAVKYVAGGASAISVLTESDQFDGDLVHLEQVVAAVSAQKVPVMRKDFLVDKVQVLEARAAGASGVLLIAAILDDRTLANMLDCAFDNDMFVLLEAFSEDDLSRVKLIAQRFKIRQQAAQQKFLIGINTRDLMTLEVDRFRLKRYGPLLPEGVTSVAESGLLVPRDAERAVEWGYRMALVGTALMRNKNPRALIEGMLTAGRSKVSA